MGFTLTKTRFGKSATAGTEPVGMTCRQLARRASMLAQAVSIIGESGLPRDGEAVHGIMTGRYDLMHVLVAILAAKGTPCHVMRIATLSYNGRNMAEILAMLDDGRVGRLNLICSKFFKENTKELYAATVAEFAKRQARIACPRCHCKVVCFDFGGGDTLILEGSANLRTNGNWEQFALINDRQLHDWHAAWQDGLLAKHEINET